MTSRLNTHLVGGTTISLLMALVGCGGGGDQSTGLPPAAPTSVSGIAAKGIVKQARVLVCRIANGAPESDASCALGVTSLDGSFNVTLADGFTGPAMVNVMTNTSSMMLDESTGIDIPYNMTMRSVVPAMSLKTITQVTPFSEMAASWAGTTGNDAAGITLAMGQVQQLIAMTGVDLTVKPVISRP